MWLRGTVRYYTCSPQKVLPSGERTCLRRDRFKSVFVMETGAQRRRNLIEHPDVGHPQAVMLADVQNLIQSRASLG